MQVRIQKYTVEEYLKREEISLEKNEYRDGKIVSMTGGTTNHNEIAGNFYLNFKLSTKGQNYKTYIGDVKLYIPNHNLYTYPDIMIISGQPVYDGSSKITVTNPLIVVEVLSKSTKNYDKTDKFRYYRSIDSLQEYIIIDQYEYYIEQFSKNSNGQWVLTEYVSQNDVLSLQSVELKISLSNIYEGINLEETDEG
jgi:Uma2 family endonuclease